MFGRDIIEAFCQIDTWPILIIGILHTIAYFETYKMGIKIQLCTNVIVGLLMLTSSVVDQYWLITFILAGLNAYYYKLFNRCVFAKIIMILVIIPTLVITVIIIKLQSGVILETLTLTIDSYIDHALFWVLPVCNVIIILGWNTKHMISVFQQKDKKIEDQHKKIEEYKLLIPELREINKEFKSLMNDIKLALDHNQHVIHKVEDDIDRE
jgi:hypothetical protein